MKKVWIVICYFGDVPDSLSLWLESCGRNSDYEWLLVNDFGITNSNFPANVRSVQSSLEEVKELFSSYLALDVLSLENAYKLNDFKPLYWVFLEELEIDYDFWGYCDLDLMFGRIGNFIDDSLYEEYDRILGQGHLSLYRRCPTCLSLTAFPHPDLEVNNVFGNCDFFGFDEHFGVNIICKIHKLKFYENEGFLIDVIPRLDPPRMTSAIGNKRAQKFIYYRGRVMQVYRSWNGRYRVKEFCYMHLQKRNLSFAAGRRADLSLKGICVTSDGLVEISKISDVLSIVNTHVSLTERMRIFRFDLRYFFRRIRGI
ncbi:DUF6625 family protein [Roseibacillus persicicus]|uniref:DUF6625 family protein n=1 Tax=Roseibacillus persicicus TaxID=454148 RepID=UPI00398B52FA